MDEVKKAIESITYYPDRFPAEEFQVFREHKEEAKPYLRKALDHVIKKSGKIEKDYVLYFYALFLLAEFQDREAFEQIITMISVVPSDTLENLLGEFIAKGLKDVLYNTYDGNMQLLKDVIINPSINDFARVMALDVMGQLYMDGTLEEAEWKKYLKELIEYDVDLGVEVYTHIAGIICKCHFMDMLSDIRSLFDQNLIGQWIFGDYDDYFDRMFNYQEEERKFCNAPVTIQQMNKKPEPEEYSEEYLLNTCADDLIEVPGRLPVSSLKIRKNDPCPCGSGKTYRQCCLINPKKGLEAIENEEDRQIRLKFYPETGVEKIEGRLYLEDFYDQESIEIDRLFYLGFKCRPYSAWIHRGSLDDYLVRKKRLYLWEGFLKYVDKMQKEGIETNEEFDKKYSIHYRCQEWQNILLLLLEESEEADKYQQVLEYSQK